MRTLQADPRRVIRLAQRETYLGRWGRPLPGGSACPLIDRDVIPLPCRPPKGSRLRLRTRFLVASRRPGSWCKCNAYTTIPRVPAQWRLHR